MSIEKMMQVEVSRAMEFFYLHFGMQKNPIAIPVLIKLYAENSKNQRIKHMKTFKTGC